jgi:hypothetical protein
VVEGRDVGQVDTGDGALRPNGLGERGIAGRAKEVLRTVSGTHQAIRLPEQRELGETLPTGVPPYWPQNVPDADPS